MASPISQSVTSVRSSSTAKRPPSCVAAASRATDGSSSAAQFEFHPLDGGSTVAKRWCHTRIEARKFSFTWTIRNFSQCPQKTGQPLDSSAFSVGSDHRTVWRLRAYPRGCLPQSKRFLALGLLLSSSETAEVRTTFRISVLTADRQKFGTFARRACKFAPGTSNGEPRVVSLSCLRAQAVRLLPQDTLTVSCEGSVAVDQVDYSGGLQLDLAEGRLSDDFRALFEHRKFSDVVLSVGGRNLRAHKVVLAARSPVFAAYFQSDTTDRQGNTLLVVDNTSYEVLREMLEYIYAGRSPNIEKLAEDLLAAADKYELTGLKMSK